MALSDLSIDLIEHAVREVSAAGAGDYFALLKPRVMSLVVFTAFVGLVAAPVAINPLIAIIAMLAIAVGAGASGALNMWYDADIDALMTRTAKRPIPSGRDRRRDEALAFGLVLSVAVGDDARRRSSTGWPPRCSPSPSSSTSSSTRCG